MGSRYARLLQMLWRKSPRARESSLQHQNQVDPRLQQSRQLVLFIQSLILNPPHWLTYQTFPCHLQQWRSNSSNATTHSQLLHSNTVNSHQRSQPTSKHKSQSYQPRNIRQSRNFCQPKWSTAAAATATTSSVLLARPRRNVELRNSKWR